MIWLYYNKKNKFQKFSVLFKKLIKKINNCLQKDLKLVKKEFYICFFNTIDNYQMIELVQHDFQKLSEVVEYLIHKQSQYKVLG